MSWGVLWIPGLWVSRAKKRRQANACGNRNMQIFLKIPQHISNYFLKFASFFHSPPAGERGFGGIRIICGYR
jgi:hypothetical protein